MIFAQIVLPRNRERIQSILTIALHVPYFLVQLQIVSLQRFDLGAQFRDDMKLLAQLLFEFCIALSEPVSLTSDNGQDRCVCGGCERNWCRSCLGILGKYFDQTNEYSLRLMHLLLLIYYLLNQDQTAHLSACLPLKTEYHLADASPVARDQVRASHLEPSSPQAQILSNEVLQRFLSGLLQCQHRRSKTNQH